MVEDVQGAIEPAADGHRSMWRWEGSFVGAFELDELCVESNGVVIVDNAFSLKAEDVSQVDTVAWTMDVMEMISLGKSTVMIPEVMGLQKAVGIVDGADVVPS